MRQRIFVLILAVLICVAAPVAYAAEAEDNIDSVRSRVNIVVDGEIFDINNRAFIANGTTYVPLDEFIQCLGGTFTWDVETQTASVATPDIEFEIGKDSTYFTVNGRVVVTGKAITNADGDFLVPIRPVCKAFGAEVGWDGDTGTVTVTSTGVPIESGDSFYDEDDLYWLSHIIHAEASGECLEGKIAVGNVIMNRVASDMFPSTVKKVIFDRVGGTQFSPAYSGSIYRTPSEESVLAAKMVLEGVVITDKALYFAPNRNAERCWAGRNRPYDTQIGGHTFFA